MSNYNISSEEIQKLNNKEIKEIVDSIDFNKEYRDDNLLQFSELFLKD